MKQILTAFLMLCLIPLYLHPAEKVESGKKLYDENIEGRKKLYEQNFGDGKELTEQTKEWVKEDIENMGDWEYKIFYFKRTKKSYIQKIPAGDLLRIIGALSKE